MNGSLSSNSEAIVIAQTALSSNYFIAFTKKRLKIRQEVNNL
jgi:hypothetical protein